VELRVGVERHAGFASVAKSKTRSKQKRVIQSDQDVQVCRNFWWMVDELLCMTPRSSLFSMDVDFLSLFVSFFLTCLAGMWHTFFGYACFSSSSF